MHPVKLSVVFVLIHPHFYALDLTHKLVLGRQVSGKRSMSINGRLAAGKDKVALSMVRRLEATDHSYKQVIKSIARNNGAHLIIVPGTFSRSGKILELTHGDMHVKPLSNDVARSIEEYSSSYQEHLINFARGRLGTGRFTLIPAGVIDEGVFIRNAIRRKTVPFDKSARFRVFGEHKGLCVESVRYNLERHGFKPEVLDEKTYGYRAELV
jgi:hypothetical protein